MGRKRNQGKARRAAKTKQEAEKRENNNCQTSPANTNELRQSLAVQIQRMQNDDAKCKHGFDPFSSGEISSQFLPAFLETYEEARGSGTSLPECLIAAQNATMAEFADVWNDSTEIEVATSLFLCFGTRHIQDGDYNNAKVAATLARYFEEYIAVELEETQAIFRWNKIIETQKADLHTLVKFFKKRILCSCLDEKYEEVKHITKMGICYNPQCKLPDGGVEYSKTMYCDGCLCVTYCCRECQKSDWHRHRSFCKESAFLIDLFEATKGRELQRGRM